MEPEVDGVIRGLNNYGVSVDQRPDGSVLLTVAHNGRRIKRVFDDRYSTDEIIRMIKFELVFEARNAPMKDAVQYCCSANLPTYSRAPISRTRSANLWASRKIRDV